MRYESIAVRREDGEVMGWVIEGGCGHPACKKAIKQGRAWHAIPRGFAVTLPDYHFATRKEAETALLALPLVPPPTF